MCGTLPSLEGTGEVYDGVGGKILHELGTAREELMVSFPGNHFSEIRKVNTLVTFKLRGINS